VAESIAVTSFKDTQLNDDLAMIANRLKQISGHLETIARALDNLARR